jgi:hypothetical protein
MPPTDADVDNLIITMESGTFEEVEVIVPTTTSNGYTFRMPQNCLLRRQCLHVKHEIFCDITMTGKQKRSLSRFERRYRL